MSIPFSTDTLLVIAICWAAIMCGGLIKGTLGVGLPLFAVPVMSLFISSTQAIALVSVPVLVSNIWQVWQEARRKFKDEPEAVLAFDAHASHRDRVFGVLDFVIQRS